MASKSLSELAQSMRGIDIATFSTHTEGGQIAARPMSNNGEVEYDGTSYYFCYEQSRLVSDIRNNPEVALDFQGAKAFWVSVQGDAELIQDKDQLQEHWSKDLDRWFKDGVDTPGVTMVKVTATRIHYWEGEDDGEIEL